MLINLRALRVKNRLTQKEMAKMLGMTEANYCLKENGKIDFKMKECTKIMEILNETFENIFLNN